MDAFTKDGTDRNWQFSNLAERRLCPGEFKGSHKQFIAAALWRIATPIDAGAIHPIHTV